MKRQDKLPIRERAALTLRAWRTVRRFCPGLLGATAARAAAAALQPFASVLLSARIVDEIAGERDAGMLALWTALTVSVNFLFSVVKGCFDKLHSDRENQMWCTFGRLFSEKQLSMDYADVEDAAVQKQKDREKNNLFQFGNGLAQFVWTLRDMLQGAFSVAASAGAVAALFASRSSSAVMDSPLWLLLLAAGMAPGIIGNARLFRRNNALFLAWCGRMEPYNRLFSFFGFTLCQDDARAKDVRLYRQELSADRELTKLEKAESGERGYHARYAANETLAALLSGLSYAVCTLFVALKAYFGAFGAGGVVQYVGMFAQFGSGLQKLVFTFSDNAVYTVHLKSLFAFLDRPNRKYEGTLPVEKRAFCENGDTDYELELRDVSFRYPGAAEDALRHVSLKLRVGKRLAIVGRNGSGKTTFIKLLCRLHDPTEGEILLNGIDIRKYKYEEYLSLFSVVFQDFRLFAFPLGQNVAAGGEYDADRARDCLETAGFGERLRTLPKGLDTCLGKELEEDGVEISGGEGQKVALARAIYRGAPFLILDEPTAALDPVAEAEVYERFHEIAGDKTAVFISHRLASCRFCDSILVFDGGKIVQKGSHDELVRDESGPYHALWHAQAEYYSA